MRTLIALALGLAVAQTALADYKIEAVAEGLNQPWSVAFLPGGGFLVTLRPGQLLKIDAEDATATPIQNTPTTYYAGQGGYFDVVLDPEFESNQTLYLSFAHGTPDANATRVVSAQLDGDALTNVTPIFTTNVTKDTPMHYGGRVVVLPDGTLMATTGDGFEYREQAQNSVNQMGKLVRVSTDGTIPTDNPNSDARDGSEAVYASGHRNPQGLAIDPATLAVYLMDHGPKGGDEINIIEAGGNYGWPKASYGINYSGALVSPFTSLPDVVEPIHVWTPSIAPSGLAVYRGEQFSEWNGDLFVGALAAAEVRRLDIENGKVISEERVFPEIDTRVRDIRVGPEGALYVLTDGDNGALFRITRAQ